MERSIDLACDLLDSKTDQSDLLFIGRFDADYPSPEIIAHAREKFRDVSYWRCMRIGFGHPDGCSQLAYGAFQYLLDQRKTDCRYQDIDTFLMLEADCVFTRKTWLTELLAEWEAARAKGKLIVGAVQPAGKWGHDVEEHVNAVALYHPDLLERIPNLVGGPLTIGWDYAHKNHILPLAMDTKLIELDWKRDTISKEELFEKNKDVLVFHGVKSDDAIRCVREKYGL